MPDFSSYRAVLAFMAEATGYGSVNIFTLLLVCIPATLVGTVVCALAVIKKGKELADDPEFKARVAAGQIEDYTRQRKRKDLPQRKPRFLWQSSSLPWQALFCWAL